MMKQIQKRRRNQKACCPSKAWLSILASIPISPVSHYSSHDAMKDELPRPPPPTHNRRLNACLMLAYPGCVAATTGASELDRTVGTRCHK